MSRALRGRIAGGPRRRSAPQIGVGRVLDEELIDIPACRLDAQTTRTDVIERTLDQAFGVTDTPLGRSDERVVELDDRRVAVITSEQPILGDTDFGAVLVKFVTGLLGVVDDVSGLHAPILAHSHAVGDR